NMAESPTERVSTPGDDAIASPTEARSSTLNSPPLTPTSPRTHTRSSATSQSPLLSGSATRAHDSILLSGPGDMPDSADLAAEQMSRSRPLGQMPSQGLGPQ